jgi:uncharacterized membrane protein
MFWLFAGLVIGVLFFWLATTDKVSLKWYEWVLLVLGVILLLFSIQNYSASIEEIESRAATFLLLMFGLPGLIFALLGGGLAFLRSRKTA